uniref:Uncharacterized protein n=1 Tax=Ananas comosus var. bracteatus TaxID=296719 RepID=A0A6V7P7W6_ANACO|nr:unnamed protein product [Ananas comosus var. bracteatus]
MYANRPALDRGDEPWDPHRLMQKPSTATSSAVRTTLMARRGAPRRASSTSCGSASERPSEHDSSRTCAPRVSAGTWPSTGRSTWPWFSTTRRPRAPAEEGRGGEGGDEVGERSALGGGELTVPDEVDGDGAREERALVVG